MRILLVSDYATPTGGAEYLLLALRDGLRQRGHDARIFASSARPLDQKSQADYECLGTTSRFRTLLQTANPSAAWEFRRVVAEFRPDLVHVMLFLTQLSPLILPALRGVPSLYHAVWHRAVCPLGTKMLPDGSTCQEPWGLACYRNSCLPLRDWLPLMLQMRLWRRWDNTFDLVVANSEAVRQRLIADGFSSVEIVWNGVPVQPLRPPLAEPPAVAFAGRLVREKGADTLIRAFAEVVTQIPTARLLIVGDGPERERLRHLAASLGLRSPQVKMPGYRPREEVERLFGAAWVQAIPPRWPEPFPNVALEAMMRGTAVVATAAGGLTEIVQDGTTGLLVPTDDIGALSAGLQTLLMDRELAERLGRAGRDFALAHYSESTYVDGFVRLYHRLLDRRGSLHVN